MRKVNIPAIIAIMVSHCAALSASNCVFDLDFCASNAQFLMDSESFIKTK